MLHITFFYYFGTGDLPRVFLNWHWQATGLVRAATVPFPPPPRGWEAVRSHPSPILAPNDCAGHVAAGPTPAWALGVRLEQASSSSAMAAVLEALQQPPLAPRLEEPSGADYQVRVSVPG